MDKTELLEALEDSHQEMLEMLEDLPDEKLIVPGVVGEWSIKDILAHLTYWEGQIITLLFQAQHGVPRPSTVHFSAETADEINRRWYESGKDRAMDMVWQDWVGVRKQTIRRVSEFTDKDLNNPEGFSWLGDTPLYQWILNDTIEHEEEHADQIREWLEKQDGASSGNNGHLS